MHRYTFEFSVDLGKAIPEVGSLVDELNHAMSSGGFDEKLTVGFPAFQMSVQSPEPLTKEKETEMVRIVISEMSVECPGLSFRCTNVSRQSGNVLQSAS